MRIHILGICGTFMSGIAIIAKELGHQITGSDRNVYPPMSTQLQEQGMALFEGFDPAHIAKDVDCVIVGNVISRGNPALEYVLNKQIPYYSGPEWLARHVLHSRWVLAVAGTHGKTTTSSMLAWILEKHSKNPGFLIGGLPANFSVSARLGQSPYFVIEADEYDSVFCDKRSKFLHYRPKTAILNNLEYDHADIFPDLDAIKQQFHNFVKTVPGNGLIVSNAQDHNLQDVLQWGCWTPVKPFGLNHGSWQAQLLKDDGSEFTVLYQNQVVGVVKWKLIGQHNVTNALAAIAAACHAEIAPEHAIEALHHFENVKRRMEVKGCAGGVTIYDDFAHHPTAIATTLAGLRAKIGPKNRLIAVVEFGSFTMKAGVHKEQIEGSLHNADMVICKRPDKDWGLEEILKRFKQPASVYNDVDSLVKGLHPLLKSGDHVVIMSNSGFGDIHKKLIDVIVKRDAHEGRRA